MCVSVCVCVCVCVHNFRVLDLFYLVAYLVADMQLYMRLCLSVGPLHWSVHGESPSVIESKSGKKSVLDTFCVCLSVWRWRFGCGWKFDAPAHPSASIMLPRVTCF